MKMDLFENIINKQFDFQSIADNFQVINNLIEIPQNPKYHGTRQLNIKSPFAY